jgi:hypothetical protein
MGKLCKHVENIAIIFLTAITSMDRCEGNICVCYSGTQSGLDRVEEKRCFPNRILKEKANFTYLRCIFYIRIKPNLG